MKNILGDSDDNNFEMKKYKFNPIFKDKSKLPNNDKNKKQQNNYEYIPNKKLSENDIPSISDNSTPKNTLGQIGAFPTLNKQKANSQRIQTLNDKVEYTKKEDDINILRNNYTEKINLLEQDYHKKLLKIEEKNKQLIENIKEIYDNKINEIRNQMVQHLSKINRQNLDLLNEIRTMRTNYIPLQEHYEKVNDLNIKWEEKFKNYKKNYENKYKQISMKIENELPLDKIFTEINTSLTPENLLKMIKLIELRNKIGYYSFILNLQEKYNEDYEKFDEINKEKIRNLKKYSIQRFDDIIKDDRKNIIKLNSGNQNNFDYDKNILKKSEIVNYESNIKDIDKSGINNIDGNHIINLNISKSISITQDKFSSELESFNFNDDSIPNKNIQVLSPPEMIK